MDFVQVDGGWWIVGMAAMGALRSVRMIRSLTLCSWVEGAIGQDGGVANLGHRRRWPQGLFRHRTSL